MTKRIIFSGIVLLVLVAPVWVFAWQSGVVAEAYFEANLRATTDVNADLIDTITAGTQYPVVGRSEFFPWLLLGDPVTNEPYGWVFQDLVEVTGNINTVPFSTVVIAELALTLPTSTVAPLPSNAGGAAPTDIPLVGVAVAALPTSTIAPVIGTPSPTPTPTIPSGITGRVLGEINVRYGPGTNYPRIGVARAGEVFEITAYHTTVPWVQIRYDAVAGGFGWVAIDLLEVNGNIRALPGTSRTDFQLPTLTPTPDAVQSVQGPEGLLIGSPSPEFAALGERLWASVLEAGFEPETSRLGSLFLMDLETGEALTFGDDIAYSGMSLSKINILAAAYRTLDSLPDGPQARTLANMMICSENTSSNQMLSLIGGTPYEGAAAVTAMLEDLGLTDTFMVAPFLIDPRITPQPVQAPSSPAHQTRANPDPY
ncbi:MAG: SH3 domain-containing protein, partial [Chloroflexota bacterium]